jgi:plastocyanin
MRKTGLLVFAVLAMLVTACGGGETVADGGEVTITMSEYQFEPSEIHLTAGTTVTFVLKNEGEKDHEMMAGREVHVEDGIPHGFETDFFGTVDDLTIDPPDAQEMEMEGMGDMSSDTTMGDMASDTTMGDMGGEEMDMGVMVVREPTQTARITFTVTDASVGEWDFACFEEDGAHYDDGMKGKIIVEEA